MIQIGTAQFDLHDPLALLALGGIGFAVLILVLMLVVLRRAGQQTRALDPMAQHLQFLGQRVQSLSDGGSNS